MFVSLPKNQEKSKIFVIFLMFLANCCLLMTSLTYSLISGIILLFFLVLGMVLIPLEWVSSTNCAYPSLTANLPNPTCFPDVFLLPYKALLWAPQLLETHSKGLKTILKTRKNSRMIPEISEKVRLAIKRQQLARNIKKMTKFFDFSWFFGNETNIWISC